MRTSLPILAVVTVALLASAPAVAQLESTPENEKKPGDPTSVSITLDVLSPSEATLTMEQLWEGRKAPAFRQSLDAYFGNGDKNLSAVEIGRIAAASEDDMLNMTLPWITLDDTDVLVTDVDVTLENFEAIGTSVPLRMVHSVTLFLTPSAEETHRVAVDPLWNAHLTVAAPEGWVLAQSDPSAEGASTFEGDVSSGHGVLLTMKPAPAPEPEDDPAEGAQESLNEPPPPASAIPGPGAFAALLAAGLAAAIALLRKGRRE